MMMRVYTRAPQGRMGRKKVSRDTLRRRAKILLSEWKTLEEKRKMLCMSSGIFFHKGKLLLLYLAHFFLWRKLLLYKFTREFFPRVSADDLSGVKRAPLRHQFYYSFTHFLFLLCHSQKRHNEFCSFLLPNLWHNFFYSNAIKTLAKYFSWNGAEKNIFVRRFSVQAFFSLADKEHTIFRWNKRDKTTNLAY